MRPLNPAAGFLSYFTRHGTAANLLLVVMLVAGALALPNMRAQFFPDVVIDSVSVNVRWEGAGAEDVDRAIVETLTPALQGVEGIESSDAASYEGQARIRLEFEPGWDMARAANDVQDAVDAITDLPEDADDPVVRRGVWRDRVTDVVISGPVGIDQLGRFADELVIRLFQEGVTRTTIRGLAAPNTLIEVPSLALIRHDITMQEIANAIAAEADANPSGDVSGQTRVRTGMAKRSGAEISAIVLRSDPNGGKLTIGDIARVEVQGADRERAYFVGDHPAISLRVDRSDRGDAIRVQAQVQQIADELATSLPQGVTVELIRTRAEHISDRLNILLDNGLVGLGLVLLLLFLFLNARTAFWVAMGIPAAMTAALALMWLAGLTINMVSLFALIITLGIVVDDAIVVGEHADFRHRVLGESPVVAAENSARRMFPPVLSATITTVIAFGGLLVIDGRFGALIADIPFTVIVVLLASLVECFLILPNHMSHAIAQSARERWYDWPSRTVNKGFDWVKRRAFRPFMRGVIIARYPVLAGAVVLLSLQVSQVITGEVQWRFWNAPERASVSANFAMTPSATRQDSLAQMKLLQQAVEEVGAQFEAEHGRNPVLFAMAEIGGTTGRGLSGQEQKDADQLGSIAIELIDRDLRPYSSRRFIAALQEAAPRHAQLETLSFRGWRSGPGGDSLDIQLFGAQSETLKAAAERLKAELALFAEISALEDTLSYDKEELVLELTPQGQALGLSIDRLGQVLRHRLGGIEAATYPDGPRTATIRVELPTGEVTADFIERTQIRTPAGAYVPLADIVSVNTRTGFSTVLRENGIRVVSVTGDLSEDDPARATEIQDQLRDRILPKIDEEFGVQHRLAGLAEQENDFLNDALLGLVVCLSGIYLTLSWIFASWTRPLVVMSVIPFGLIGAIFGHWYWDVALSMFSIIGLLGMVGIIINDSIVLVTTIDEHSKTRGLVPAIIDGAADRLRPVLLTTLTTVLGLTPLLFEPSQQAEFLKPTIITLVYGLGFGMVLVLLIVPALIASQHDFAIVIKSMRRGLWGARSANGLRPAMQVSVFGLMLWFVVSIGTSFIPQTRWEPVLPILSWMSDLSGFALAITFLTGAIIWLVLVFGVKLVLWKLEKQTRQKPVN